MNKSSFMRVAIRLSSIEQYSVEASGSLQLAKLDVLSDARRIRGGCSMRELIHDFAQPTQLRAELLDDKLDHPDGFMKIMAHFLFNRAQRFQFAVEFTLQKFLTTLELFQDGPGRSLPGKRHPGKERRTITLVGPVFAFKRSSQSRAPFRCGGEDVALGTERWFVVTCFFNQSKPCQLFQRVIDLGTRHSGPVLYLTALQFEIGLIAVHGLL